MGVQGDYKSGYRETIKWAQKDLRVDTGKI